MMQCLQEQTLHMLVVNGIVHHFPFLAPLDDAQIAQHPQLVGYSRLLHAQYIA
ncbi:hypothetical protein D3C87_1915120 [compost metagenome]